MSTEPVAWMDSLGNLTKQNLGDFIPLYTHPVKEHDEQFKKGFEAGKEEGWKAHKFHHPVKELTDKEIHDLIINKTTDADMIKQAIRKAQEK